jgi:hypothetical protein
MSTKLEGKWYISIYDEKTTSTYAEITDVEILGVGNWIRYKGPDGKTHVTNYPVRMRTDSTKAPGGD